MKVEMDERKSVKFIENVKSKGMADKIVSTLFENEDEFYKKDIQSIKLIFQESEKALIESINTSEIYVERSKLLIGLSSTFILSSIALIAKGDMDNMFIYLLIILLGSVITAIYSFACHKERSVSILGNDPKNICTELVMKSDNLEKEIYRRRIRSVDRGIQKNNKMIKQRRDNYTNAIRSIQGMLLILIVWMLFADGREIIEKIVQEVSHLL